MSELSLQGVNVQPKKTNYVKKGAKIGAGAMLGASALSLGAALRTDSLKDAVSIFGSKRKVAAFYTIGLCLWTAVSASIGAGIGKLIQNHKEKQETNAQKTDIQA